MYYPNDYHLRSKDNFLPKMMIKWRIMINGLYFMERTNQKLCPEFNQLEINESLSVYICQSCMDKFVKWQQKKYAKLFPTKRAKELFKE